MENELRLRLIIIPQVSEGLKRSIAVGGVDVCLVVAAINGVEVLNDLSVLGKLPVFIGRCCDRLPLPALGSNGALSLLVAKRLRSFRSGESQLLVASLTHRRRLPSPLESVDGLPLQQALPSLQHSGFARASLFRLYRLCHRAIAYCD
ncbi:MAG: hypothetical protein ACI9R3_003258 [Verrucomicrobiales bacterium]|jgi:hypothetical protein